MTIIQNTIAGFLAPWIWYAAGASVGILCLLFFWAWLVGAALKLMGVKYEAPGPAPKTEEKGDKKT